jgi:DNA-binding MarR family transcriptional regulator
MSSETPPFEPLLGALLRFSWQQLRLRLLDALQKAGYTDLNASHLNVFQYPPPQGVRPIDLAQRASMTRQAMNYLLTQLEESGYLTRSAAAGKNSLVSLTDRGMQVSLLLRSEVRRVESEWAETLGKERFDDLVAALRVIAGVAPQGKPPLSSK